MTPRPEPPGSEQRVEECPNNWRDGTCPKCGQNHYVTVRREPYEALQARLRAVEAAKSIDAVMEREGWRCEPVPGPIPYKAWMPQAARDQWVALVCAEADVQRLTAEVARLRKENVEADEATAKMFLTAQTLRDEMEGLVEQAETRELALKETLKACERYLSHQAGNGQHPQQLLLDKIRALVTP